MRTPAERLADFGVTPRDTQRALAKLEERHQSLLPTALKFAKHLEAYGLDSTYFRSYLPPPKQPQRRPNSLSRLCAYLWPDTKQQLSHMSGSSTVLPMSPYNTRTYDTLEVERERTPWQNSSERYRLSFRMEIQL